MNLDEIRKSIDDTDDKILKLFSERMELCLNVAEYKKKRHGGFSGKQGKAGFGRH